MFRWPRYKSKKSKPKVSVVVVGFNMERELNRTIFTLEPPYQAGLEESDIEIILVDNGSRNEFRADAAYSNIQYLHVDKPTQSPAAAINLGLRHATADLVGIMIDGARMVSPQLLRYALLAGQTSKRAVISTLAYHLGPDVQMVSVEQGYNQTIEDELLDSVPWQDNGYELFNISVFAGSSLNGWFVTPNETNALFMPKKLWVELGGVDELFNSPGGGLINHDTFLRACELPDIQLISLLGEGTFHQVHGGVATNSKRGKYSQLFREEYQSIRGKNFSKSTIDAIYIGCIRPEHIPYIEQSVKYLRTHKK